MNKDVGLLGLQPSLQAKVKSSLFHGSSTLLGLDLSIYFVKKPYPTKYHTNHNPTGPNIIIV